MFPSFSGVFLQSTLDQNYLNVLQKSLFKMGGKPLLTPGFPGVGFTPRDFDF